MKKILPIIPLLSVGFTFSGISQEAKPTTPVEAKPTAPVESKPTGPLETKPAAQANKPKQSAPKPKQPTSKPKPAEPKKYVLKSGDNPWTIAQDHGVDHAELLKLNKIEDPKDLQIGQVLVLPKGVASKNEPKKKSEAKPAPVAGPKSGDGWETYTIQSGDNPWTISKKLKVDHQEILSLNEGLNFRDLKIGQEIKVPKKS